MRCGLRSNNHKLYAILFRRVCEGYHKATSHLRPCVSSLVPRAQMHMFAHIYVNSSKLSSISYTFQHKRFLSSYVRSLWIQRDEPDGVLISSLLVPYRMPKLECLRVNHLDLKQEHTSLSLFASTSSLRTLDLDLLQECTSPQLLRISVYFQTYYLAHTRFRRHRS